MRRGDIDVMLMLVIIELVIALFAGIVVFDLLSDAADASLYWQRYYARDVGLLVSILHAPHANAELLYDNLRPEIDLRFTLAEAGLKVASYDPAVPVDSPRHTPYRFPLARNVTILNESIINAAALQLYRTDDRIGIGAYGFERCPYAPTPLHDLMRVQLFGANLRGERAASRIAHLLEHEGVRIVAHESDLAVRIVELDGNETIALQAPAELDRRLVDRLDCLLQRAYPDHQHRAPERVADPLFTITLSHNTSKTPNASELIAGVIEAYAR